MSELTEDDIWFCQKMANDGNSGYLVTTKHGVNGSTYHKDKLIDGKQPVYVGNNVKLLCDPETLTINGFID